MPIILISLLAIMSLGSSALAERVPATGPEQFTQSCQTSNPRLERLASAIQRGEIDYVRTALDEGVDVNETWRDLPAQICLSLLLRSIGYRQDEIFSLLLKRGADPRSIPRESLGIPVRKGRVAMVGNAVKCVVRHKRLIWLLAVFGALLVTQVRLSHGERRFAKSPPPPLPTFDLRVR